MPRSKNTRPGRPGKQKRRQKPAARRAQRLVSPADREWIGGIFPTTARVDDGTQRYSPLVVLWLEVAEDVIVGSQLTPPTETDGVVGETLRQAMARPLMGRPRRPGAIRVATAELAAEVIAVVGESIPVHVAPTPELDEVVAAMNASLGDAGLGADAEGDDRSATLGALAPSPYLAQPGVQAASVERLFRACEVLHGAAPWTEVADGQTVRIDIPALEVEGRCLTVVGHTGDSRGFMLFDSEQAWNGFVDAAIEAEKTGRFPSVDGSWLVLGFERGADLPDAWRREIGRHGWPVAAADAYPLLMRFEGGLDRRPITDHDVQVTAAVSAAFAGFFLANRGVFATDAPFPVCETRSGLDDVEVRLCAPSHAFGLFDPTPVPAGESAPLAGMESGDLVDRVMNHAVQRFGRAWLAHMNAFQDAHGTPHLAVPWAMHDFDVDGQTAAASYLEAQGDRLPEEERAEIRAEMAAWLSIWEVTSVEPGEGLALRDVLTGERRTVRERTASRSLVVHDLALARVVDRDDGSYLSGLYPRVLPPDAGAAVIERVRRYLQRKRDVPIERLRGGRVGRYLIRRWEEAVAAQDAERRRSLRMTTPDGEPIMPTTDYYRIASYRSKEVRQRLREIPGVEPIDDRGRFHAIHDVGDGAPAGAEQRILGHATISGGKLALGAETVRRLDDLTARILPVCEDLVTFRRRHTIDPELDPVWRAHHEPGAADPATPPPTPEMQQVVLDFKRRHYATWADEALPALGGRTPREAVRTADGRREVDQLLRTMQNHEARAAGDQAFDFSEIRRELGLET
ncbi:DUF2384 domain-containing protein [bacterium]|nr:DUF2384 domain-containing protein [bacterium]